MQNRPKAKAKAKAKVKAKTKAKPKQGGYFTVYWIDEGKRGRVKQNAEVVHSFLDKGPWVAYGEIKGMVSRIKSDQLSEEDGAFFDNYDIVEPWERIYLAQELRKWIYRVEEEYKK